MKIPVLTAVCLCFGAGGLSAQTTRTFTTSGNWNATAHWTNGIPVNNDSALIQVGTATGANNDDLAALTLHTLTENGAVGPTVLNAGTALTLGGNGLVSAGGNTTAPNGVTVAAATGSGKAPPTATAATLAFTNGASASYQKADNTPVVIKASGSGGYLLSSGVGVPYPAGSVTFSGNATAGLATLNATAGVVYSGNAGPSATYYSYVGSAGTFTFTGNASGGNARVILDTSSTTGGVTGASSSIGMLDISGLTVGGTTLGSLEGSGQVMIGKRTLAVGGLGTSTVFSGAISGFGGTLAKIGPGTLTLSGQSDHTGGTTVSLGTLKAGAGGYVFGPGTMMVNTGTLDLGGQDVKLNGLLGSGGGGGGIVNNGAAATLNLNNGNNTYTGSIADGTGALTLAINGGFTFLSGSNSFTGGINLNAGTLSVAADGHLGAPANPLNFNGGTLQITGDSLSGFNNHPINAGTFNGGLDIAATANMFTINQNLSGGGSLTKLGAGTLYLNGRNSYTGATNVNAGMLTPASSGALAGTSAITIASGAFLNVHAPTIPTLSLTADQTLTNNGTFYGDLVTKGAVLGTGTFNGAVTIGGTLGGAPTIAGPLTVTSGGVVALSGGTLTANGGVVNNGTMRLAGGASLAVASGQTFTNNGVLDIITGSFSVAPSGFRNNGVILDSGVVRAKRATLDGGGLTVAVDGYTGHTYQLQVSPTLANPSYANVGDPQTGSTGTTLMFTDPSPAAGQGFYRVRVD